LGRSRWRKRTRRQCRTITRRWRAPIVNRKSNSTIISKIRKSTRHWRVFFVVQRSTLEKTPKLPSKHFNCFLIARLLKRTSFLLHAADDESPSPKIVRGIRHNSRNPGSDL
jgi:hypothetical protein